MVNEPSVFEPLKFYCISHTVYRIPMATISMPPTAKVLRGHIGFVTSICSFIHTYVQTVEYFLARISIKHLVMSYCKVPEPPLGKSAQGSIG